MKCSFMYNIPNEKINIANCEGKLRSVYVMLTLTASRMRMALAKSLSLRHALRAESRILASGTRSYPIKVFIPSKKQNKIIQYFLSCCCFICIDSNLANLFWVPKRQCRVCWNRWPSGHQTPHPFPLWHVSNIWKLMELKNITCEFYLELHHTDSFTK